MNEFHNIVQYSFYVLSYLNCNRGDTYCWPACPCWHSGHSPDWAAYRWRGGPGQWPCRSCGPRRCPRQAHLWTWPSPGALPWALLCSACQSVCLADAWSAVLAGLDPGPPPGPGPGTAGSSASPSPDGTWIPLPQSRLARWGSGINDQNNKIIMTLLSNIKGTIAQRTEMMQCFSY